MTEIPRICESSVCGGEENPVWREISTELREYSRTVPHIPKSSLSVPFRNFGQIHLCHAELERAFEVWWSVGGVAVIVPKDTTFAFVESYLAMREMGDWYRVNKARRTKHEALMEERAGRRLWRRGS
eukprot:CCRYP_016261-RA/>CCRYP_016261-RA protein AED:0.29 eAED:0.29 QI:0/-1/0/1/-1/1/1/0/126